MKEKSIIIDSIIIGLALFSTMFGAGNLIFPPQIGLSSGTDWAAGAIGLLITGIILPVLALWAVNNVGTGPKSLMDHVHPKLYFIFLLIVGTLIGLGSTLPRSAATAHEVGVLSLFPDVHIWITVPVFFALVFLFAKDKDSVIDKLGKYLTPLLLAFLAVILIKGVIMPVGEPIDTGNGNAFVSAMITAYCTGDLTVGLIFAGTIISAISSRGYSHSERKKSCIIVGLVCIIALFSVYGTLTYLGATASSLIPADASQTAILSGVVDLIMGRVGLGFMGVAVALACLTTAIGIGSMFASYFTEASKEKLSYKTSMLIICIVSTFMGVTGVQNIIKFVTPIFLVVYPICIVLTILGLLNKFLPNDGFYKGSVLLAGIVSLGDAILVVNPNIQWVQNIMSFIPLSNIGFSWLVPSILGAIVGAIIFRNQPKYRELPESHSN